MEEVVGPLNLVPVEKVALTKLKVFKIVLLDERLSRNIQASEEPTSARALLVGDWFPLSLNLPIVNVDRVLQATEIYNVIKLKSHPSSNLATHLLLRQASSGSDLEQTFCASLFLSQE